jgi:hypothetical protein
MEILKSNNYDQFSEITGNRNLSEKKIEKIIDDVTNGLNLLPYCPIIVYKNSDNELKIVDGQHRFEVSKRTENPVFYVVCSELSLQQIASMNSKQDKWTQSDFLRCYVKIGIEDYIILDEILKKYHIGISAGAELLMAGKIGARGNIIDNFREGTFKVKFQKETEELLELSHSLFDRYNFFKDRYLISAVQELMKKGLCDFDVLREKISSAPMQMDKQATTKDYIFNIERVYNFKNHNRVQIF